MDLVLLPARLNWLIFAVFCYLLRFGLSSPKSLNFSSQPLVRLFIIIIFWEGIQGLILGRNVGFYFLIEGLTYIVFLAYFSKSIECEQGITRLIKPYNLYYVASVIVIFLTVFLIVFGLLSPTDNPITENALMNNNISTGSYYYWPGHLSVVNLSTRLDVFNLPVLCGFSHEPHVLAQTIFPAFFLLLYVTKDRSLVLKSLLVFSLVFVILFSYSTTSMLALSVVIFLDYTVNKNSNISQKILILLFFIVMIYFANKYGILDQIIANSSKKIGGEDNSKDYSSSLLMYGLTPSGILGEGIYVKDETAANFSIGNVGLISCVLCNLTYLLLIIKSYKNFRSSNSFCHYVGMAVLYFSIHSLKLGCLIYNSPMMFYMIYLLSYSDRVRKSLTINLKQ